MLVHVRLLWTRLDAVATLSVGKPLPAAWGTEWLRASKPETHRTAELRRLGL